MGGEAPLLSLLDHRGETSGFPAGPPFPEFYRIGSQTRTRRGSGACDAMGKKKSGPVPRYQTAFPRFDVFEVSRRSGRSPALPYPP